MEVATLQRHMLLGEILMARGYISGNQLDFALVEQRKKASDWENFL